MKAPAEFKGEFGRVEQAARERAQASSSLVWLVKVDSWVPMRLQILGIRLSARVQLWGIRLWLAVSGFWR
jgi:hypothetical protein